LIENSTPSDQRVLAASQNSSQHTSIRSFIDGVAIVVLCVFAACIYGVVHDQITARVCIEYFTIGHPHILKVPSPSPTLLGFVWGIVATWWVGLGLGIPLAMAAQIGVRPKTSAKSLVLSLATILAVTGTFATIAGVIGYLVANEGWLRLFEPLASRVPTNKHSAFIADLFAHNASYIAGAITGIWLIVRTWRTRNARS
jgi:hypothetical protein